MIDGDGSSRRTMKSMQNQKVAKTKGETNNFEGRPIATCKIVKKKQDLTRLKASYVKSSQAFAEI